MCQKPKDEIKHKEYLKTVEENKVQRKTFKQRILEVENTVLKALMTI